MDFFEKYKIYNKIREERPYKLTKTKKTKLKLNILKTLILIMFSVTNFLFFFSMTKGNNSLEFIMLILINLSISGVIFFVFFKFLNFLFSPILNSSYKKEISKHIKNHKLNQYINNNIQNFFIDDFYDLTEMRVVNNLNLYELSIGDFLTNELLLSSDNFILNNEDKILEIIKHESHKIDKSKLTIFFQKLYCNFLEKKFINLATFKHKNFKVMDAIWNKKISKTKLEKNNLQEIIINYLFKKEPKFFLNEQIYIFNVFYIEDHTNKNDELFELFFSKYKELLNNEIINIYFFEKDIIKIINKIYSSNEKINNKKLVLKEYTDSYKVSNSIFINKNINKLIHF
tara:strand:+ start:1626 stop:2654 length:1029 start_codon:yes stop_codon:yes gene_type:complete